MPKLTTPGRYNVTVTAAEFGQSEKGTPFLQLSFATEAGETINGWLYFSEAALEKAVETLREAFDFNDDFETAVEQVVNKQCSITVEIEEDDQGRERIRVKWINPLSNVKPIEDAQNFLRKLSARAKLVVPKAKEGKAPAPTRPPTSSLPRTGAPRSAPRSGPAPF